MKTSLKTILLPTDFSSRSENALQLAANMARRHKAKLLIMHAVHTYYLIDRGGKQAIGAETVQQTVDSCRNRLQDLQYKVSDEYGIEVESRITTQSLVDSINDMVLTDQVDVVVVGTSGQQNVKHVILGSNSYSILLHANCSVLLVPEAFTNTSFKKILFPVRVPHELEQKTELSLLLANKNEGDINLLGVGDPENIKELKTSFLEIKRELALEAPHCVSEFKLSHDNAQIIADEAKKCGADIIILAHQDEDSWKSFMADNFFKKIINKTEVPLLIVKSKLQKINNNPEPMNGFDITLPIPG